MVLVLVLVLVMIISALLKLGVVNFEPQDDRLYEDCHHVRSDRERQRAHGGRVDQRQRGQRLLV